jgi:NAD(P)H dehydrogenase (quinone)
MLTGFMKACNAPGQRLDTLWTAEPIAYRPKNAGAYDIPALTLPANIARDQVGFGMHIE